MGKSVHDHRRAAGIPRASRQGRDFFYYGNEKLAFDDRSDACVIECDPTISSKNRDEQVFATFLDYKNTEVVENLLGEQFAQVPLRRLSLKDIKQRIKDYNVLGKNTDQLILARDACKKEYPTHCPRLV